MRIAIIGVGGVGGTLAGDLARSGATVELLARGEHLAAIRTHGLRVETPDGEETVRIQAHESLAGAGPFDLAIVAVKSWSLEAVGPEAARLAGQGATIVPLLNGVDAVERLVAAGVPEASLLGGLVYVSATRPSPGHVRRTSPFRRAVVGEPDGGASARAQAVAAELAASGWEARATDDIRAELWRKYTFITAFASACALSRTAIGRIREAPLGPELLDRAVDEIVAVARALGIDMPDSARDRVRDQLDSVPADMRPSLVHDLLQGGPTEVDALSGGIARRGRRVGVPTPVHDAATAAIHASLADRD